MQAKIRLENVSHFSLYMVLISNNQTQKNSAFSTCGTETILKQVRSAVGKWQGIGVPHMRYSITEISTSGINEFCACAVGCTNFTGCQGVLGGLLHGLVLLGVYLSAECLLKSSCKGMCLTSK